MIFKSLEDFAHSLTGAGADQSHAAGGLKPASAADFREKPDPAKGGLPGRFTGIALTIGNFDGCHLGHRALIERSLKQARARGLAAAVMTFEPHPEVFFGRLTAARLIFTLEQRLASLSSLGVDGVIVQAFDRAFASVAAAEFATGLLRTTPRLKSITVGTNFHFGAKRSGSVGFLRDFLGPQGVEVDVADLCDQTGLPISSSRIRDQLEQGQVAAAGALLGQFFSLTGTVERGDRIGHTLGFPTANLGGVAQIVPGNGVYVVQVTEAGSQASASGGTLGLAGGVCNIGVRPTVGGEVRRIEVHLLDRHGIDLYGKRLDVRFVQRLRPEKKFSGIDELRNQIALDCDHARELLAAIVRL